MTKCKKKIRMDEQFKESWVEIPHWTAAVTVGMLKLGLELPRNQEKIYEEIKEDLIGMSLTLGFFGMP
ncbi:hypothetical protein IJE86_07795 [bacterium]|nr:hypothetical protein [bacterium]